ncbi:mannose-1-phosphate guanylyltransferase [Clostridium oryzae]|uniref:mannose-1-phosphate guanylyltransferase n=1 Tax=Clostridium oryzae TaxID=1450648 RepID=A0A1V4ILI0_9CLOT|nr:mannose-1-phosphate guanylyltransferase [Clostridium oryzae]OPJ60891.1 alginate biosynthesis protein AlgA [Clostridium oryzae]
MLCVLIMAGGKGERFWPLSTDEKPKQFLNLLGKDTMIQMTVNRMKKIVPIDRIFVVTGEKYVDLLRQQIPDLPERNIIVEPIGRNTAPCIALSALVIDKFYEDSEMVVVPSDHLVTEEDKFIKVIASSSEFVKKNQEAIVTIGIKPDRPEIGYGYIKANMKLKTGSILFSDFYKVDKFVEKPTLDRAKQYMLQHEYLWNSGMFIWKTKNILKLIQKYLPNTYEILEQLSKIAEEDFQKVLRDRYMDVDNISIDYGIMEKAENIYVAPAEFGWDDVGTWKSVERYREKDVNNNIGVGNIRCIEGSNNIIMGGNKPIVVVGLNDILVAETNDIIFIGKKENIVNIKETKKMLDRG